MNFQQLLLTIIAKSKRHAIFAAISRVRFSSTATQHLLCARHGQRKHHEPCLIPMLYFGKKPSTQTSTLQEVAVSVEKTNEVIGVDGGATT